MQFVDYYEVGGSVLKVESSDEKLARIGRDFIGGFHLNPLKGIPDCNVNCLVSLASGVPHPITDGSSSFKIQRGQCFIDGSRMILNVDESQINVESNGLASVSVILGSSDHARHPTAVVNVLSYALPAALRRCGLYEIHSAAVVEPETNTGVLLVGDSNSGKSSLTVRLANQGWKYLTDDMIVIKSVRHEVEALALRKVFAISQRSIEAAGLSHLAGSLGSTIRTDRSKRRLEPSRAFPESFAKTCLPGVLCFVSIADQDNSRTEEISQSDAMIRMVNHCAWSSYDEHGAADFLKTLGRLVGQTRCFTLAAGRDVLNVPRRIADIFNEILSLGAAPELIAEIVNG